MRKLALLFLMLSTPILAQQKSKVLATINSDTITVNEFKKVYEKNLNIINDASSKDVEKNLNLYINYRLKVNQAYNLQLDTLQSYKREIETYKNQLTAPYLQDDKLLDKLIRDAYNRTKYEIRASHILIQLPKNATPKDTLQAFQKIIKARNRILQGESFENVAKEVSEDPSAKTNGGNLGYFSAFKMVFPFEENAYNTSVGNVSMPFKTTFGYHIVQVNDKRLSKGKVQVAHLLIADTTEKGKAKIDSIYAKLQQGKFFEDLVKQYSNDTSSKTKEGVLPSFGTGRMIKPFEKAAFGLKNVNDISKPFKTNFGWHIVKLLKKFPVGSFEEEFKTIKDQVKRSGRAKLSKEAVINKLKKKYSIAYSSDLKEFLAKNNIRSLPKDSLQSKLISIDSKIITKQAFVDYLQNRRHKPVQTLFELFVNEQVILYFKENLMYTEPEYANTLKEYKDGLLLFELMKNKIWNASNDSIALARFYKANIDDYKPKRLNQIKGKVMNDYQNYLDQKWVADLRKNNKVLINRRELKKLIKFYQKKNE